MPIPNLTRPTSQPKHADRLDFWLSAVVHAGGLLLALGHQSAMAQSATGAFGGITEFLRTIANLLIFEWGFYIGMITLAFQGYRWWTGRIELRELGGWGIGIGLVFFAPSIVADLRSRSGGSV